MGRLEIGVVVGVSGKYCAGKGVVTRLFVSRGQYRVIDVDAIGHDALAHKAPQIIACFGNAVAEADGTVSRSQLAKIVFGDRSELQRLEDIVHPWMKQQVSEKLNSLQSKRVVIDAALLCYLGLDQLCDSLVWVKASFLVRLFRAKNRDNASLRHTLRIMRTQKRLKLSSKITDIYIISNNMSEKRFVSSCETQLGGLWGE